MKKYMNMPDVKIVRFENKDVIATSDKPTVHGELGYDTDINNGGFVQARRSIWE